LESGLESFAPLRLCERNLLVEDEDEDEVEVEV